ncbi:MAG: response regulator, partial [Bacillota bacterium]|nr:response regulator [Bacillota bacterium]
MDDEPHVVDTMVSLLEAQPDLSLELYYAFSGQQAMDIMKNGKIDLLITDIQMPDMTGLELVDTVNRLWPLCKTIFLTAYSDFNYAYEAIQKHVVSYMLKSEDDDYIIREVRKTLTIIKDELNQRQALDQSGLLSSRSAQPVSRELFPHILMHSDLSVEQLRPMLSILGFHEPMNTLYLLYGIIRSNPEMNNKELNTETTFAVQDLFYYNMSCYLSHAVCELDEYGNLIWILQPDYSVLISDPTIQISGTLETVQSSCLTTAGIDISFVLSAPVRRLDLLAITFREMRSDALGKSGDEHPFIFTL